MEKAGHVGHVWETGGVYTGFWWRNLRERDHWEDLVVDGRIILKWIFKMGGIRWIDSAQHRDRWRGLVNVVI
jgi:hypothetical protein